MNNTYAALKQADDPRWTKAKKCDLSRTMANLGKEVTEAWTQNLRDADTANAEQLTKCKRTSKMLLEKHHQVIGRNNMDYVLSLLPAGGVHGQEKLETKGSAEAVQWSLQENLLHSKHKLADCRFRVTKKTQYLAQLRFKLAMALTAEAEPPDPEPEDPDIMSPKVIDKTVDALRVANRKAARARDLITKNIEMRRNLKNQLIADLNQQASIVQELFDFGLFAQKEATAFDKKYCRLVAEHEQAFNRLTVNKRNAVNKSIALESTRRKMIINELQQETDETEPFEIGINSSIEQLSMSSSGQQIDIPPPILDDNIPFMEWMNTSSVEHKLYPKRKPLQKENSVRSSSSQSSIKTIRNYISASLVSDDNFTFPIGNINKFVVNPEINEELSKEMEAVEYVCDTLGFSDMESVLQYFQAVKNVEMRLKKVISQRKHIYELSQLNLEKLNQTMIKNTNCFPESILLLDKNINRIKNEGLDVQNKQLEDIKIEIAEYDRAFNELWFQLENLAGKLDRCQVPVVRKFQKKKRNTEWLEDAESMLEELHLRQLDNDGSQIRGDSIECSPFRSEYDPGLPIQTSNRLNDTSVLDNGNTAVDACRKLVTTLHTKVKACMFHIGNDFDTCDNKQRSARAYFGFNQQYQYHKASVENKDRSKRQVRQSFKAANVTKVNATSEDMASMFQVNGILTREQAKQKADEIVQWYLMHKDTDEALIMRKPLSFRKSRNP